MSAAEAHVPDGFFGLHMLAVGESLPFNSDKKDEVSRIISGIQGKTFDLVRGGRVTWLCKRLK